MSNKRNSNSNKPASGNQSVAQHNGRNDLLKDSKPKPEGMPNLPNDYRWYYGDLEMGDEISRFSFNQFAGLNTEEFKLHANTSYKGADAPTLMVFPLNPCPGVTNSSRDSWEATGINQAMQQYWTLLTSRSGRGAQYSKSDVGMVLLALGEVISMIEYARRFFGLLLTYDLRNRTLPAALIQNLGIDADDFIANASDYRIELNKIIATLNGIPIPANIDYFAKCQDLYQKIWTDSTSRMAQFYAYVPATTWIIDEAASSRGTVLKTVGITIRNSDPTDEDSELQYRTGLRFSSLLTIIHQQVSALLSSTSWSTIYADILNAAALGHLNLWTFESVKEDYVTPFEYNELELIIIHNIMTTGVCSMAPATKLEEIIEDEDNTSYTSIYGYGTPRFDVYSYPDDDILVYNPLFAKTSQEWHPIPIVVDSVIQDPSPEMRIEASVFKLGSSYRYRYLTSDLGDEDEDAPQYIYDLVLPDHYVIGAYVFFGTNGFTGTVQSIVALGEKVWNYGVDTINAVTTGSSSHIAWLAAIATKFQWAPMIFGNYETVSGDTDATWHNLVGELNYYTDIAGGNWIKNVTDAKNLGIFSIKSGKSSSAKSTQSKKK